MAHCQSPTDRKRVRRARSGVLFLACKAPYAGSTPCQISQELLAVMRRPRSSGGHAWISLSPFPRNALYAPCGPVTPPVGLVIVGSTSRWKRNKCARVVFFITCVMLDEKNGSEGTTRVSPKPYIIVCSVTSLFSFERTGCEYPTRRPVLEEGSLRFFCTFFPFVPLHGILWSMKNSRDVDNNVKTLFLTNKGSTCTSAVALRACS